MGGTYHQFTSGKAAAADTTVVDGPDWDAPHYYVGDSVNVGALIYAGASGKLTNLNSVGTGQVLISQGVGVAPVMSGAAALNTSLTIGSAMTLLAAPTGASISSNFVNLTAAIPTLSSQFTGVHIGLTEPDGATQTIRLLNVQNTAAAAPSNGALVGIVGAVQSATTGTLFGVAGSATGSSSSGGKHYGVGGSADDGDWNFGVEGNAYDAGTYNLGVVGNAEETATNSIGVLAQGGVDGHLGYTPPSVSAALVANQLAALPIFLALDNAVEVFKIADGGVVTSTVAGFGTSSTAGLILTNTTAAANGAQQISPGFDLVGQGWKTNATAASQEVRWRQEVLPVQGAAAPTSTWKLKTSVNGGAFTEILTATAAVITSTVPLSLPLGSSSATTLNWGTAGTGLFHTGTANMPAAVSNGTIVFGWRSAGEGLILGSTQPLSWSSGTPGSTGADLVLSRQAANRLRLATGDVFNLEPTAFGSLPTGVEGDMACVTDSNTATWGATIAGGGANNVLAFFNGTNWTVAAA